ncbi:uncharacterized protein [Amphiura filiformis]|uniref:uncharacterized protein n=1 Tax=Amphiura filiformis TaxID=82378 RepID=UPI003B211D0C
MCSTDFSLYPTMYFMCLAQNIVKQNFLWQILILGQLLLFYQCQELQPSSISPYCQQHHIDSVSETEQRLRDIVRRPDFCPWSEECNGTCDGKCTGRLRSIKGYCTTDSVSARDACIQGQCLCTDPKLTCFQQKHCPCYTDDIDDVISKEECCIHAIDCIMGSGKNTESKSCFIKPDDPRQVVQCHDLAGICKVLEEYVCDNSCLTSTQIPTTSPTIRSNLTHYTNIDDGTVTPQSRQSNLVYYIVGPILILVVVCVVIVTVHCVRKKRTHIEPEEKVDDIDRYTTVDHPQRTECPPDVRDSNLDNPLYDMQVVGESTLSNSPTSLTRPTDFNDNTRSYENMSQSASVPSSPTSESEKLLPDSKTSTANSSSNKLNVPVFNALQNRQRVQDQELHFATYPKSSTGT